MIHKKHLFTKKREEELTINLGDNQIGKIPHDDVDQLQLTHLKILLLAGESPKNDFIIHCTKETTS